MNELLQLMAEEAGLQVDKDGFARKMAEQKDMSRKGRKAGGGGALKFEAEATAHLANSGVAHTDDKPKYAHCPPSWPILFSTFCFAL